MAWEWAGEVGGIDPTDRSLRELYWALTAHRRAAWDHTAHLLTAAARLGGNKDVTPDQLHPYRGRAKGAGWGAVFGAARQMAAERRKKQPEGG